METQIRVSAVVIKGDSFLVIKRAQKDEFGGLTWTLPCGRAEFGEKLEESIEREVKEETCLDAKTEKIIGKVWSSAKDGIWAIGICFLCRFESGEVRLSEEHNDYRWIKFSEIENADIEEWIREYARAALK
jgi:8-oxo-dGTP diphosphatase